MWMLTSKQIEFFFEWVSTFILLAGAALTSLNIYPMNVFLSLAGNLGWLVVSLMWRKPSLIVIQLVISFIYVAGLIDKGVILWDTITGSGIVDLWIAWPVYSLMLTTISGVSSMAKTDPHKNYNYSYDYLVMTAFQHEINSLTVRKNNDNITPIVEEYLRDRVKEIKERWK